MDIAELCHHIGMLYMLYNSVELAIVKVNNEAYPRSYPQ